MFTMNLSICRKPYENSTVHNMYMEHNSKENRSAEIPNTLLD